MISSRRTGLLLTVIILAAVIYVSPLWSWLTMIVDWARLHSVAGPVAYILLVVVGSTLLMPGSVSMMIGGFVFGFLPGALLASIAVPLGAQAAFESGRWIAREWVRSKVAGNSSLRAIEAAVNEKAFVVIFLTRVSLILPFNLLNYAFGASAVKAGTHLVASALGMLPAVVLYTYLGTLARDLGQILSGDVAPPEMSYWIGVAGVIVLAIGVWIVRRTAGRALKEQIAEHEGSQ